MASAYPTLAELQAFLSGQGYTLGATGSLPLAAAVTEWEIGTGFIPFLAELSADDYTFDPPYLDQNLCLQLRGGFATVVSVTVDDEELTEGADGHYILEPTDRTSTEPIRSVRFISFPGRIPQSVVINGRRGYGDTIPDDAFFAIMCRAAALSLPQVSSGPSLVSEVKQGSVDVKYDSQAGRSKTDSWNRLFKSAVRRYRCY